MSKYDEMIKYLLLFIFSLLQFCSFGQYRDRLNIDEQTRQASHFKIKLLPFVEIPIPYTNPIITTASSGVQKLDYGQIGINYFSQLARRNFALGGTAVVYNTGRHYGLLLDLKYKSNGLYVSSDILEIQEAPYFSIKALSSSLSFMLTTKKPENASGVALTIGGGLDYNFLSNRFDLDYNSVSQHMIKDVNYLSNIGIYWHFVPGGKNERYGRSSDRSSTIVDDRSNERSYFLIGFTYDQYLTSIFDNEIMNLRYSYISFSMKMRGSFRRYSNTRYY